METLELRSHCEKQAVLSEMQGFNYTAATDESYLEEISSLCD